MQFKRTKGEPWNFGKKMFHVDSFELTILTIVSRGDFHTRRAPKYGPWRIRGHRAVEFLLWNHYASQNSPNR